MGLPDFNVAWKRYTDKGYSYGEDALEQVRMGYRIAGEELAREIEATLNPPAGIGCRYCYDVTGEGCEMCRPKSKVEAVAVGRGKYIVMNDNGRLTALRNGEPWDRDLVGDKLVLCMMQEILNLQKQLRPTHDVPDGHYDVPKERYGKFWLMAQGEADYVVGGFPVPHNEYGTMLVIGTSEGAVYLTERQAKAFFDPKKLAPGERCPHCSFDPTSSNDYCEQHRPSRAAR